MSEVKKEDFNNMFKEAVEKNLWFYSKYSNIWFTPSELREQHNNNKFLWPVDNWILRPPMECYNQMEKEITKLEEKLSDIRDRMKSEHIRWKQLIEKP